MCKFVISRLMWCTGIIDANERNTIEINYTPNGYTVPAKFGARFLPCIKNDQKRTKIHLNEVGLTSTEFFKIQIQLRQPPIS